MYMHPDQTWRNQPRFLSLRTLDALAGRLAEYARDRSLSSLTVVAHGGEPLLLGADRIRQFFAAIDLALGRVGCAARFGVQTNGMLVDEAVVLVLQEFGVRAGVSLDGPPEVNDQHRVDKRGHGSARRVLSGVDLLRHPPQGSSVFGGFLSVADPRIPPAQQLDYFVGLGAPYVDFLLPDYNHDTYPGDLQPGILGRWLVELFDLWLDNDATIEIRTFSTLMRLLLGSPFGFDAFGANSRGVVIVETDGTYHALDVLKTAYEGATVTGMDVWRNALCELEALPLVTALSSKAVAAPDACLTCPVFSACGGGYLPHRYSSIDGFTRRSVYCEDLYMLLTHMRNRLERELVGHPSLVARVRAMPAVAPR
jgi:uncharacterized protein